MIRVGIIGATGYTGQETLKILLRHKHAKLTALTALPEECGRLGDIFPQLHGLFDVDVVPLELEKFCKQVDAVFCCLPHKVSMQFVPKFLQAGLKVVDFSADYRLRDVKVYQQYYAQHSDPDNIARAAFGLPELFRQQIRGKDLVANPGCYPTCAGLGLAALLDAGLIELEGIIVNAVSGVSGAGRKATLAFHFPEINENLFAYATGGVHRHSPEIDQICSEITGGAVKVLFQPHVASIDRGMLCTIYAKPREKLSSEQLLALYRQYYRDERFVRILDKPPMFKAVANSNFCDIHPTVCADGRTVIVFSAIDNLIKGAAGQAVQNLNIIYELDETEGLL